MTQHLPIRYSYLKAMAKSPARCLDTMLSDGESTEAQQRGTALHAVLFDTARVVTAPEGLKKPTAAQRNAKKPKPETLDQIAKWDAWQAENAGAHILTPAKYTAVMRMADAVRADPYATEVLGLGQSAVNVDIERTLHCEFLGRRSRMTPDVLAPDRIVDLKSTKDASQDGFPWQFRRYGYGGQLAFYNYAAPREAAYVVAVEPPPPGLKRVEVVVFKVPADALEMGLRFCHLQMERLINCERSGQWPGYAQGIVDLVMPVSDDVALIFPDDEETDEAEAAQ